MNQSSILSRLKAGWIAYLKSHKHWVQETPASNIILSRNGRKSYRWFLVTEDGPVHIITMQKNKRLKFLEKQARRNREGYYLVVGFTSEPGKIVVLPVRAALKNKRIPSDKAGIDWNS